MRIAAGTGGLQASAWRLGLGLLAAAGGRCEAAALPPEFPSFHLAVVEQDARSARAFIAAFPDSPLIADLIVMLPPATAQEVCAGLPADGAPAVAAACHRAALLVATGGMDGDRLDPDRRDGLGVDRRSAGNGGDGAGGARLGAGARGEVVAAAAANTTARALTLVASTAGPGSAAPAKDRSAAPADPAATDPAGEAQSDRAPAGPRPGRDPGSDPGVAAAPSSHDSDAGSDGGGSGGSGAKDSHR
jgi:hypothetical protein